ncbi:outer membrane protein assembly factor BamD [Aestuariivirga sp.]|uniref:outer membrane protein assembly factor BamD n=1 Tax=Aestuariivirga sp. TaxID=2650926 RepID=UPI0035947CFF
MPVIRKTAHAVVALAIAMSVTGCATNIMDGIWGDDTSSGSSTAAMSTGVAPDMASANEGQEVAKLYNEGLAALADGSNKTAVKKFAEVERQYPYSSSATKSILMQAYAQYRQGHWDDTIVAANRFVTLHPGHKDAGYAYYLIAVSNYNRISDAKRDQTATKQAVAALEEVAQRYPGTAYAQDAAQKVIVARDHLAGKEMEVGRYYYRQGSYLAGINRFKRVVTDFQNTSQTPEALYRLSEGYMALGVVSEAQTAAAVLGHNYPNSDWYKDAYRLVSSDGQAPVENEESWISKAFDTINPL